MCRKWDNGWLGQSKTNLWTWVIIFKNCTIVLLSCVPPVSCPLYTYASPNANIKPEYLDNIHIYIVAVMCGTPPNGINTVPVPSFFVSLQRWTNKKWILQILHSNKPTYVYLFFLHQDFLLGIIIWRVNGVLLSIKRVRRLVSSIMYELNLLQS